MKRKIRRKSKHATGVFARALSKVDSKTQKAILKPGELKEWLIYSKRFGDSEKLADSMRVIVKNNEAWANRII